jgi:hypothetical protein
MHNKQLAHAKAADQRQVGMLWGMYTLGAQASHMSWHDKLLHACNPRPWTHIWPDGKGHMANQVTMGMQGNLSDNTPCTGVNPSTPTTEWHA